MSRSTLAVVGTSLAAGTLFAIGLGVSGMTRPGKVVAFLDFSGDWDPSLALVMVGAIAVYSISFHLILRRPAPLMADVFGVPTRRDLTPRLVGGAVLFGLGLGLAGYCPGPAITSVVTGAPNVLLFVAAMTAGMLSVTWFDARVAARRPIPTPSTTPQPLQARKS